MLWDLKLVTNHLWASGPHPTPPRAIEKPTWEDHVKGPRKLQGTTHTHTEEVWDGPFPPLAYLHVWRVTIAASSLRPDIAYVKPGYVGREATCSWSVRVCSYHTNCCCSVAQSCRTLFDPSLLPDCSTPGSSVLHCLPEFAQIHVHWVHWVSDAI